MDRLAHHRETRHRGRMAPGGLPTVLAMALPCEDSGWTTSYGSRDPPSHPPDGGREPHLGRAADSRRVAQAGCGGVGAHGVSLRAGPGTQPHVASWLAFLRNHREAIAAMDLFTVPNVSFRQLDVFFVISHAQVPHADVTEHPTASWITQQLREAFPDGSMPTYLLSWIGTLLSIARCSCRPST